MIKKTMLAIILVISMVAGLYAQPGKVESTTGADTGVTTESMETITTKTVTKEVTKKGKRERKPKAPKVKKVKEPKVKKVKEPKIKKVKEPKAPKVKKIKEPKVKKIKEPKAPKVKKSSNKKGMKKFYVFTELRSDENHFIPSGWMGDTGDIKYSPRCRIKPFKGQTCVKIDYSAEKIQGAGWAGIYWQYPANNWGVEKEGFDLTGIKKLEFWARGEKGDEIIAEFNVGGITGKYPDSTVASIGPIMLTKKWKKYTINLKDKDLSHIIGGFSWSASAEDNPSGFTLYLDEIQFVK
ncbi:MAG: hypothetical protein ABH857_00730 [Elusimicrobiota bacterium]